jgi:hypothetical protein
MVEMERPQRQGGLRRKAHRSLHPPWMTGITPKLSTTTPSEDPASLSTINAATMRLCRLARLRRGRPPCRSPFPSQQVTRAQCGLVNLVQPGLRCPMSSSGAIFSTILSVRKPVSGPPAAECPCLPSAVAASCSVPLPEREVRLAAAEKSPHWG